MENRIIFREMLTEIKKAANEAGGVVTRQEVRDILSGMPLEEAHFQLIYDYLAEQNIRVVELREEVLPEEPSEDGRHSLSVYLDELSELSLATDAEEIRLLAQACGGDPQAEESLIERYLPLVCSIASEYEGDEILAEDLIQEGNLGLLAAVRSLKASDTPAARKAHILNGIQDAMKTALNSGQEHQKMDEGLVSRMNHLNEAIHNLERDLGHRVSAEELSAYLEMPLAEIDSLLRMSGDQIELKDSADRR